MLIPRVMNGLEKSITFSRSAVMVRPATARSAFWKGERAHQRGSRIGQGTRMETKATAAGGCYPGLASLLWE